MTITVTATITRPSGDTTEFFYDAAPDLYPGSGRMREYLVMAGLITCEDTRSEDGTEFTRVLSFSGQIEFAAFRHIMNDRFPEYAAGRDSYCETHGHTLNVELSEEIEDRFYDPSEELRAEITDLLLTL